MLNVLLIVVLLLHAAPYGLEMIGQYDFDIYIYILLLIISVQSVCIYIQLNLKLQKVLTGFIIAISLYFLINYGFQPWQEDLNIFQLIVG